MKIGREYIKEYAASLPKKSGIYRMIGENERILYIGKARNLRNRVSSYVNISALTTRIMRMVEQTRSIEIIITPSEAEALLLEASLIKQLKPYYNILLKDDKSYPYIHITDHKFPRIEKYRGAKNKNGEYFGAFANVGAVNDTLDILQKAFLLRPCSNNIFENRTRPCLQYQIKRCCAPCVDKISTDKYAELINEARAFLKGKSQEIQKNITAKMQIASDEQQYEQAAIYRDRLSALNQLTQNNPFTNIILNDADAIAIYGENNKYAIQIFFFRGGNNYGNRVFYPTNTDNNIAKTLEAFLTQFYHRQSVPKTILINKELENKNIIEEALSIKAKEKISLIHPKQGNKKILLRYITENAKNSLQRKNTENLSNSKNLANIAELFSLSNPLKRIEIYDNSHISSTNAVGAMVVAGENGFDKKSYRKFYFDNKIAGDDYAMLKNMLTRRFKNSANIPDLLLIDGGIGQFNITKTVIEELDLKIPFVAIAKGEDRNAGREEFFTQNYNNNIPPFRLPVGDSRLFYLQILRDEAHNFAINSHRNRRAKGISKSLLDEIPNIGATRKKSLLQHFGSVRAISNASLEEITQIEGISENLAKNLLIYLH